MHKWLAPSSIHFLKMHRELIVESDENLVIELSNKLAHELPIKVPKMQVTEKDGSMFALNNSSLQLMRQLEKQGKLSQIQVEVVPLSKVPFNIQQGMIADTDNQLSRGLKGEDHTQEDDIDEEEGNKPETSKSGKKKGYHKLQLESTKSVVSKSHQSCHQYPMATSSATPSSASETDHELEDDEEGDDEDNTSDSSSSSEALSCNVCDRSFSTARQLAQHQLQKRHFGCSVCDTVFPSLMALEEHKETLEHWSDDENHDNEQTDDDELDIVRPQREELERLL